MLSEIQKKVADFASSSSVHGVAHLATASTPSRRGFWAAVCAGAGLMLGVMVAFNMAQYYSHPTTVDIYEDPGGLVPPYISFCNHRHISMEVLQKYINIKERNPSLDAKQINGSVLDEDLHYFFETLELVKNWRGVSNSSAARHILDRATIFTQMSGEIIHKITNRLKEFIVSCKNSDKKCVFPDYMQDFMHSFFYKCYTYDRAENTDSGPGASGINQGLTLLLLSGSDMVQNPQDVMVVGFGNSLVHTGGTDGLRVVIHPRGTVPDPLDQGVDVPTGGSVVLGVTSQSSLRLKQPYGNCTDKNVESVKLIGIIAQGDGGMTAKMLKKDLEDDWSREKIYTTADCMKSCEQTQIWLECGCLDVRLPAPIWPWNDTAFCRFLDFADDGVNISYCRNHLDNAFCKRSMDAALKEMACMDKVRKSYSTWSNTCRCHPECSATEYQVSYSLATWPARGPQMSYAYDDVVTDIVLPQFQQQNMSLERQQFVEYFKNKSNINQIMHNFAKVTIYYKSTTVTKITQIGKYTLVDSLSSAGGLMGLWLGISVISLFELANLLISICKILIKGLVGKSDSEKTTFVKNLKQEC